MVRFRGRFSTFALLWAVLQFALPAGLGFLDSALADRGGRGAPVHMEETSGKGCQPPHTAACVVCRFLSTYAGLAARLGAPAWPAATHDVSASRAADEHSEPGLALERSRAPPPV